MTPQFLLVAGSLKLVVPSIAREVGSLAWCSCSRLILPEPIRLVEAKRKAHLGLELLSSCLGREATESAKAQDNIPRGMKIVLVGDSDVGKTHLLSRYSTGCLPEQAVATIGVQFAEQTVHVEVAGTTQAVKVQLWDTAGEKWYRPIASAHYGRSVGALLVYDVTRKGTFESCATWIKELRQLAPDIVIMLVGNKADLVERNPSMREVYFDEALAFAGEHGLIHAEASAVSRYNVPYIFNRLLQLSARRPSKASPATPVPRPTLHPKDLWSWTPAD